MPFMPFKLSEMAIGGSPCVLSIFYELNEECYHTYKGKKKSEAIQYIVGIPQGPVLNPRFFLMLLPSKPYWFFPPKCTVLLITLPYSDSWFKHFFFQKKRMDVAYNATMPSRRIQILVCNDNAEHCCIVSILFLSSVLIMLSIFYFINYRG